MVTEEEISIHAPTRGATVARSPIIKLKVFQSTLPREERPPGRTGNVDVSFISIHAPTRGATFWIKHKGYNFYISIHAPTRGATLTSVPFESKNSHFNPRSHERSDVRKKYYRCVGIYFNPRSHERSDRNIAQKICLFLYNTDNKYIIR